MSPLQCGNYTNYHRIFLQNILLSESMKNSIFIETNIMAMLIIIVWFLNIPTLKLIFRLFLKNSNIFREMFLLRTDVLFYMQWEIAISLSTICFLQGHDVFSLSILSFNLQVVLNVIDAIVKSLWTLRFFYIFLP